MIFGTIDALVDAKKSFFPFLKVAVQQRTEVVKTGCCIGSTTTEYSLAGVKLSLSFLDHLQTTDLGRAVHHQLKVV